MHNHNSITSTLYLLNQIQFDWSPTRTILLNSNISSENSLEYNQTLVQRLNNIIDDLVLEGINEIYEDNQKEIEKIMIKRIWR